MSNNCQEENAQRKAQKCLREGVDEKSVHKQRHWEGGCLKKGELKIKKGRKKEELKIGRGN